MDFFLLAGGYGMRARPLSLLRPKPVFPLNNEPLINIMLRQLKQNNLKSGYINLHYLPEKLKELIDTELDIKYVLEDKLSGSAVLNTIDNIASDYVLIINGDVFLDVPVKDLYKNIRQIGADGILLIREDKDNKYSKLEIKNNSFIGIAKDNNNFTKMYGGVAIFKREVLKEFIHKSFFTSLKKNNFDIRTLEYNEIWIDLGSPRQYYDGCFKYDRYIGKKSKNIMAQLTAKSKNIKLQNSIIWNNVRLLNNISIKNSIILDDTIIDNLDISNKIVYNHEGKLTLVEL
jgi:mannose-1-phosphate guanylyltransferase